MEERNLTSVGSCNMYNDDNSTCESLNNLVTSYYPIQNKSIIAQINIISIRNKFQRHVTNVKDNNVNNRNKNGSKLS